MARPLLSNVEMMTRGLQGAAFALTCATFLALLEGACGGSARTEGGTTSAAGAAGEGSVAGGPGSAGRGCEAVDCSSVTCGVGEVRVHGTCCDTCAAGGATGIAGAAAGGGADALNCDNVNCNFDCPADEFPQTMPGSCCPVCAPKSADCVKGQAGYEDLRSKLLAQPGALSCAADSDCTQLPSFPKCGDLCAFTPVAAQHRDAIAAVLGQWETDSCGTCPETWSGCPVSPSPVCESGQCVPYHHL